MRWWLFVTSFLDLNSLPPASTWPGEGTASLASLALASLQDATHWPAGSAFLPLVVLSSGGLCGAWPWLPALQAHRGAQLLGWSILSPGRQGVPSSVKVYLGWTSKCSDENMAILVGPHPLFLLLLPLPPDLPSVR